MYASKKFDAAPPCPGCGSTGMTAYACCLDQASECAGFDHESMDADTAMEENGSVEAGWFGADSPEDELQVEARPHVGDPVLGHTGGPGTVTPTTPPISSDVSASVTASPNTVWLVLIAIVIYYAWEK